MANYFIKKDISLLLRDADDPTLREGGGRKLERTLGVFSLVMLGVGAIIGAGIFSLIGTAAANYSGPAIIYSFVIAAVLCTFAGLSYAEMAAMVPVAGSAYTYSYATLGELVAWIIGWDLILEYTFGAVAVCSSWSGYFLSLVTKTLGIHLPDKALLLTRGPWEQVLLSNGSWANGLWNVPASLIAITLSALLFRGMKETTSFNNLIVAVKLAIIFSFIGLGWGVIDSLHWIANPAESGLSRLVPLQSLTIRNGHEVLSFGWPGVLTGAGIAFFAYIGFDAISTTAQECKNPGRDLPMGILLSLLITAVVYILMALVITGIIPYRELGVSDPIAFGVDRIVDLRGWSPTAKLLFTCAVKVGALAGLTSGLLLMFIAQTRVYYSMAKDGLLPWFDRLHPKFSTPHIATMATGGFVALCTGVMPMSLVGELCSIGTLLAFALVCIGIPILRKRYPNIHRPFKTPVYWLVAPAGVLSCLWVMYGLPVDTWLRLLIWLLIGFGVYFGYGYRHSKLRQSAKNWVPHKADKVPGVLFVLVFLAASPGCQKSRESFGGRVNSQQYSQLESPRESGSGAPPSLGPSGAVNVGTTAPITAPITAKTETMIRIGEVGSLTGISSTFGRSTHRGILLAIQEINEAGGIQGRKLELITEDDRSQADEAVLAVQKLIHQRQILALLGEASSSISLAVAPVAQQFHIPMITPSAIHSGVTQVGEFIFRVCFLDQFQSKVMARFAFENLQAKRVVILRDMKSDYSQDSSRLFAEAFEKEGGKVVAVQTYSSGDMDFKAQLTAIRALKPDLIVVPGYYTEVGLIARQQRELGIVAPLLGGDGWDSPKLREIGGSALEGSYFVGHYWPDDPAIQVQRFQQKFKATYGGDAPDGLAALGYDAAGLLAEAFRHSEFWDGEHLKSELSKIRGFSGVTGNITIGTDRNAVKRALVFKLGEGGKLSRIIPVEPF